MKKLNLNIKGFVFTTLLVSVIFCGCDEAKPNKEPTKIGVGIEYRGYNISTIEYDGHDYIMCAGGNGGGTSVTMIHSESCKLCGSKKISK